MITIYEIATGKALLRDPVDAKEILKHSPELYSATPPGKDKPEGDATTGKPSDGLKVDELKAALEAKGIAIPEGAKKADLAALLDAA